MDSLFWTIGHLFSAYLRRIREASRVGEISNGLPLFPLTPALSDLTYISEFARRADETAYLNKGPSARQN